MKTRIDPIGELLWYGLCLYFSNKIDSTSQSHTLAYNTSYDTVSSTSCVCLSWAGALVLWLWIMEGDSCSEGRGFKSKNRRLDASFHIYLLENL